MLDVRRKEALPRAHDLPGVSSSPPDLPRLPRELPARIDGLCGLDATKRQIVAAVRERGERELSPLAGCAARAAPRLDHGVRPVGPCLGTHGERYRDAQE